MHDTKVSHTHSISSNSFLSKFDGLGILTKSTRKKIAPGMFGVVLSVLVGSLILIPINVYSDQGPNSIEQIRLEAEAEFANEIQKAKSILNEIKNNPDSDEQTIELAVIEYKKAVAIAKQIRDEKIQQAQLSLENSAPMPKISLSDARKQLKSTIDAAQEQLQKAMASAKKTFDSAMRDALGNEDLEKQAELEYENALKSAKETYNKLVYEAAKQYQKMKDIINA